MTVARDETGRPMIRKWARELRNADLQAQSEASSRHTYGLETQPSEPQPECPHCHSTALYTLPSHRVLCHGCGRSYAEDQLK